MVFLQVKAVDIRSQKSQLKYIEDLSAVMEERLILDNRYVILHHCLILVT